MPYDADRLTYFNRESSWLEFDHRVLMQALHNDVPLLERLRFLSIACTNLDEFFMVRVASLKYQHGRSAQKTDAAGMTAQQQLDAIHARAKQLYSDIYSAYETLMSQIQTRLGIEISDCANNESCEHSFEDTVYPVLTPVMVGEKNSEKHPFPFFPGKTLILGFVLKNRDTSEVQFALLPLPCSIDRLLPADDSEAGRNRFCLLESTVKKHAERLFPKHKVLSCSAFRLTRDGDLPLDEGVYDHDLADAVKRSLGKRKKGKVIRLETEKGMDERLLRVLQKNLNVGDKYVYSLPNPLDLSFLSSAVGTFYNTVKNNDTQLAKSCLYPEFSARTPNGLQSDDNIFDILKKGDLLLYHPFETFDCVLRFLRTAAADPDVVAVKMTLYRLSKSSPVVDALAAAARAGKHVTAFIEARARFDEASNLAYGEILEQAGVNVIYGLPSLKTHSKIALVLRREADGMHKYTQLGTGNYNDVTARLYTDYSLLTADMAIGADGVEFFRCITGCMDVPDTERLVSAPADLRPRFRAEIKKERKSAEEGGSGYIFAKMNSLTDPKIIRDLYKASCAGVKIRLIVRGACCLVPGVEGLSENIEVRSVVGRFLEHSRVYIFGEGDTRRVYLSSADWMTRNLETRVELLFPLPSLCADRVHGHLETYWEDASGTYALCPSGKYTETDSRSPSAQERLLSQLTDNTR